jgi:hypothetical protein
MKKILGILLLGVSFQANALQVIMQDGCPVAVDPGSDACPGSRDACFSNGAVVRWTADGTIDGVSKKSGEADLLACNSNGPQDYQCVVQGRPGDSVDYGITVNGCPLDPRIIIQ